MFVYLRHDKWVMNHQMCSSLRDILYYKKVTAQGFNIRTGNFVSYVQTTPATGRLSNFHTREWKWGKYTGWKSNRFTFQLWILIGYSESWRVTIMGWCFGKNVRVPKLHLSVTGFGSKVRLTIVLDLSMITHTINRKFNLYLVREFTLGRSHVTGFLQKVTLH